MRLERRRAKTAIDPGELARVEQPNNRHLHREHGFIPTRRFEAEHYARH
jgi:hypothetical protein